MSASRPDPEPSRTPDPEPPRSPVAELPNVPLLDESIAYATADRRPRWRGWIHAATFPAAIVAGVVLVALADGPTARTTSAIFAGTSVLLFGVSAAYHRLARRPVVLRVLRRFDHANIFLLIAGTYTPVTILCLPLDRAVLLLTLVWGGALLGVGVHLFWASAPRWLYVPLYLLLGWTALMDVVDLVRAAPATMALVLAGGLLYTAGAIVYWLRRPDPRPGVFGFHEVFHALTVLAFAAQWAGILLVATHPPHVA